MFNAIPFLLDFFALSRGYGIGMGLFMGFLYYLMCFFSTRNPVCLMCSLILVVVGSLAVMTMIYLVAFVVVLVAFYLIKNRNEWGVWERIVMVGITIVALAVSYFLYTRGSVFADRGALLFGASDLIDALSSLVSRITYDDYRVGQFVPMILTVLVGIFLLIILRLRKIKPIGDLKSPLVLLSVLTLFVVGCMMAQHFILGTSYPPARAMQYLIPLYLLMIIHELDQLSAISRKVLTTVLVLLFSVNFVAGLSFDAYILWSYDSETKDHYEYIAHEEHGKITVTTHPLYRPTFNYYNALNAGRSMSIQDANPENNSDYTINVGSVGFENHEIVTKTQFSTLLKSNKVLESWPAMSDYEELNTTSPHWLSSEEFYVLNRYSIFDSIIGSALVFVEFNIEFENQEVPTAHLVLKSDKNDPKFHYSSPLYPDIDRTGAGSFSRGFWLTSKELSNNRIEIHLWNKDKQKFSIEDLVITWYR
jgi:heme/copper-type cytochrome/quinol oxidase subunit 2